MTLKRNINNDDDNQQSNKDDDFNFSIRWKMSPKLRIFISTATDAGKVVIKVGKILIPLLIAGSIALQQSTSDRPQLPPQVDSIELFE